MMKITDIFDFFATHRHFRRGSLCLFSALLVVLLSTLHFSEDISDFLPLGTSERECMDVYQSISGSDKLFVLFSDNGDDEETIDAIDCFVANVGELDNSHWCESLKYQFDTDDIGRVTSFVYEYGPYFLEDEDYIRIDSLLCIPNFLETKLNEDKLSLLFPSSSFVSTAISHDPLGLFTPALNRLNNSSSQLSFELQDGYIFTPDKSRAVVMLTSPFGNSETEQNSVLLSILESAAEQTRQSHPEVSIDVIGGPAIAVGNSERIKKDSILAIVISAVLIVLLLAYSFQSLRNILLILLSVGWGLVFALGGIAIFSDKVSIIVIGISSVILGIAINYPLHLVAHSYHQHSLRECLKEISTPLVVGNITTVGAFLALVPLKSTALRDLGLFASLLLLGTILFVLVYLPHYVKPVSLNRQNSLFSRLSHLSLENSRLIVGLVVIITVFLAYFSLRTEFDSDMSHINYMTESQINDMQYFEDLLTRDMTHKAQTLYVFGKGHTLEDAICEMGAVSELIDSLGACGLAQKQNEAFSFLTSREEQSRRLAKWSQFVEKHSEELTVSYKSVAKDLGFSDRAFDSFDRLVSSSETLAPLEMEQFQDLTETVFMQNVAVLESSAYAVCPLNVEPENVAKVKELFNERCFDVSGMNDSITRSLSDNFNYIGWVCSLIVFFFLWFSFGRLELAIIAFLPMAVSWLWILGLMSVLGIKFNIVNIILATFIFGQGDDYTIFVTEGCQYDYSRQTSILSSYKSSILQSAAIMFVGIGTLIVAKHPAMKSLAEVTIIGMFSVVLMAYLIPPLLFRLITTSKGKMRLYPLTIRTLLFGEPKSIVSKVRLRYAYKGKEIERQVRTNIKTPLPDFGPNAESYDYSDAGYGELSILMAYSNPSVAFVVHIPDDERRRIAEVAASGFVSNIEFTK